MLLYSLLKHVVKNRSPLFFYSGYLEGVKIGERLTQQSVGYYKILFEEENLSGLSAYDVLWVCPTALLSSVLSERVRDISFGSAMQTDALSVMAYIGGLCFGLQSVFGKEVGRYIKDSLRGGKTEDEAFHSSFMGAVSSFQLAIDLLISRIYEDVFLGNLEDGLMGIPDNATFYENLKRSKICMDYNILQKYKSVCASLLEHTPNSGGWLTAIADFEALNETVYKIYAISGEEDVSQYVPLSILKVIDAIENMIQAGEHYA